MEFRKIKGVSRLVNESEEKGGAPAVFKYVPKDPDKIKELEKHVKEKGTSIGELEIYVDPAEREAIAYSKAGKDAVFDSLSQVVDSVKSDEVENVDGVEPHKNCMGKLVSVVSKNNYKAIYEYADKLSDAFNKDIRKRDAGKNPGSFSLSLKASSQIKDDLAKLAKKYHQLIKSKQLPDEAGEIYSKLSEKYEKFDEDLKSAEKKLSSVSKSEYEEQVSNVNSIDDVDDFLQVVTQTGESANKLSDRHNSDLRAQLAEKAKKLGIGDKYDMESIKIFQIRSAFMPIMKNIEKFKAKKHEDGQELTKDASNLFREIQEYSHGFSKSNVSKELVSDMEEYVKNLYATKMAVLKKTREKDEGDEGEKDGKELKTGMNVTGYYALKTPKDLRIGVPEEIKKEDWIEVRDFKDGEKMDKTGYLNMLSNAMSDFMYKPEPETLSVINSYSNTRKLLNAVSDATLGKITLVGAITHELLDDPHQANPKLDDVENSIRKKLGSKRIETEKTKEEKIKREKMERDARRKINASFNYFEEALKINEEGGGGAVEGGGGAALEPAQGLNMNVPGVMVSPNMDTFSKLGPTGTGVKKRKKSVKPKKYVPDFKNFKKNNK